MSANPLRQRCPLCQGTSFCRPLMQAVWRRQQVRQCSHEVKRRKHFCTRRRGAFGAPVRDCWRKFAGAEPNRKIRPFDDRVCADRNAFVRALRVMSCGWSSQRYAARLRQLSYQWFALGTEQCGQAAAAPRHCIGLRLLPQHQGLYGCQI